MPNCFSFQHPDHIHLDERIAHQNFAILVFNLAFRCTTIAEDFISFLPKIKNTPVMQKISPPITRKAMISSTARDLPEHRKQVQDACLRQGFYPIMMEHLPANEDTAIPASLKMVDEADIYVGIFALRYGYVPKGHDISVTEMEYNRAVERGIPRLIFIAGKNHVFTEEDMEPELENIPKLRDFKARVGKENIVNFFKSHEELRTFAVDSLSQLPQDKDAAYRFHPITIIPELPAPYIAHPYVLSQAKGLIGRRRELSLLTDWITAQPHFRNVRILNVVAIGGMGKSALTWEWFQKIAPQEWPQMQGRVWWSFYESDARFENFVTRTLAYLRRMPLEEAQALDVNTRETLLLETLNKEPHLLVLDGFERELVAYSRLDANRVADDDYEVATANYVAQAHGLPDSAAQSFTGQHRLRQATDRRVGLFLKRLTQVQASRILVSTRLYPFDLQMITGQPLPGCTAIFLPGLGDDDALALWREYGVSGSRERLLPMFQRFGSHPLLLQALAGEIARYRPAPGDFDRWQAANPNFNPFGLPLVQAKTHVMEYALQGLSAAERQVLHTIAAFRMPTSYATLLAVCSGADKPCATAATLDATLTQLEDRGLLGWDRQQDRYDLHPVVCGVVWSSTGAEEQRDVYGVLQVHFKAAPMIDNWEEVNSLEDLSPAIELYHALVGLGLLDEACELYYAKLGNAMLYRLGTNRQQIELLEKLFPDGLEQLPRLASDGDKAYTCNALALAYLFSGEPGKAVVYFKMGTDIAEKQNNQKNLSTGLENLSYALRLSGDSSAAETAARLALAISQSEKDEFQESVSLQYLGLVLAIGGVVKEAQDALSQSLYMCKAQNDVQGEGLSNALLAQYYLWNQQPTEALIHANRAEEQAYHQRYERDFIRAACRQGQAALGLGQQEVAHERLHHALERARKINFVEEELPALVALAELARQQGQPTEARELLEQVWAAAERGPYPLLHADALNVLCQIERDAGHTAAAIEAAQRAYQLAWCQGPPHAYHYGLTMAQAHLRALGVEV
jgi:hypothetical protein